MRTLSEITKGEKIEIFLQKGYFDPVYWIENVFGEKMADFQKEWINTVRTRRFNCIVAFRGSAKTATLGIKYPLWLAWYKKNQNILIVSSALEQSIKIMGQIQELVSENELLSSLMPNDRTTTWKKTELNTTTKCKIFTRALTPNVRGIRTDYVLADEGQDYDDVNLFNTAVEPTVDLRRGTVVVLGTPKNQVDLLSQKSKNKSYWYKSYPILKEGQSIWPEVFPLSHINEIKERMGESSFDREYMVNPKAEVESALYPSELIAKCMDYESKFDTIITEGAVRILAADFAIANGPHADFDSYSVLEKRSGKSILIWGERWKGISIDGKSDRLAEMFDTFKCESIIIDPSHVGNAVRDELRKKGLPVYEAEMHSQARNKLLINLRRMMDSKELVIPYAQEDERTSTYINIMISELLGFKEAKSEATGSITYKSTAKHDDTVLSLAMACQRSSLKKEFMDVFGI